MSAVTLDEFTRLASHARLGAAVTQRVFRVLMDTSARPGTCSPLPRVEAVPAVVLPLLALCDLETSVALCGQADRVDPWDAIVPAVTGARRATPAEADWLAVMDRTGLAHALIAPPGSASAPETAARVVVAVDRLRPIAEVHPSDPALQLAFTGPGTTPGNVVAVEGVDPGFFHALAHAHVFPCGLDVWLVDPDGTTVGIPRSCRVSTHGRKAD